MPAPYMKAQGMTLHYAGGTTSPYTYTIVTGVTDINLGGIQASEIDTTDLSSTAMENVAGLVDYGSASIGINIDLDQASHTELVARAASGLITRWKITFTDSSPKKTATFNAWVKALPLQGSANGIVKSTMELRITGAVTIT